MSLCKIFLPPPTHTDISFLHRTLIIVFFCRCLHCLIEEEIKKLNPDAIPATYSPENSGVDGCAALSESLFNNQQLKDLGGIKKRKGAKSKRAGFILHNEDDASRLLVRTGMMDCSEAAILLSSPDSTSHSPQQNTPPYMETHFDYVPLDVSLLPLDIEKIIELDSKSVDTDSLESKSIDSLNQLDSKSVDTDSLDSNAGDVIDHSTGSDSKMSCLLLQDQLNVKSQTITDDRVGPRE